MSLVTPIDGDEIGGQRLHLSRVAETPGVDATRARDRCGELTDHRDGLAVIAQNQHIVCEVIDCWIIQKDGTHMMECGDDRGLREQPLRLLRR